MRDKAQFAIPLLLGAVGIVCSLYSSHHLSYFCLAGLTYILGLEHGAGDVLKLVEESTGIIYRA